MHEFSKNQIPTQENINNKEIESLKAPIQDLLGQLRESINKGEYRILIGDDVSGRIPTLIFREVLEDIYSENGFSKPKTMFLTGLKIDSPKELQEKAEMANQHLTKYYSEDLNPTGLEGVKNKVFRLVDQIIASHLSNRKVLLITDFVSSGMALEYITAALRNSGISFDIATIGLSGDRESLEKKLGGRIFYSLHNTPEIYTKHDLAGVTKKGHDIFSSRSKRDDNYESQDTINKARSDVGFVAEDLVRWYKSEL